LTEIAELHGRTTPIVVTNGANYRSVSTNQGVTRIVRRRAVRTRIERWIQESKRRINPFYASFTGHDGDTTNDWLRQFARVSDVCLT